MVTAAEKVFVEMCNKNSHLFFSLKSYFQIFQLLSLFNADALFTTQFCSVPSLDLLGSCD